jgi:hypothetical protein
LLEWGHVLAVVDDDEFDAGEWRRELRRRCRADRIKVRTSWVHKRNLPASGDSAPTRITAESDG